jgi:Ca-activated chloride channel family protein
MNPTVLLDYEFLVSANAYTVRALLKLEGKAPESGTRQPLNLSLVLDRSGSMAGAKLIAARRAAAHLVRRLDPADTVSVVAFDDEVRTVAEPATGGEQAHLARTLESIEPGGSTNLSGGWLQGREYVARMRRKKGTNRVLLLTDGQANVGIVDPAALAGLCATALEQGITTTTIGFGDGYDEQLLQAMADAGGGNMHYIETPDQAPAVFAEEIEGLLSLAAQNITVEVRPGPAVQVTAVHHSYPTSQLPDGLRLQVGDLYAREPKMVLVELLVPDAAAAGGSPMAECTVVAHVMTVDGGVERQELHLPIVHPLSAEGHEEPEIRREMLLLGAAKAREAALREQAQGDYDAARRYLREASDGIDACGLPADAMLAEELEDLRAMEARLDPGLFNAADAKYLNQRSYNSLRSTKSGSRRISRTRPRGPGTE